MCPEPSLLVAYLDGTLFHRDASDVDDHVATCKNCSDLLAAMRRVRAEEQKSKRARRLMVGIGVAAVAVAGVGAWAWLRSSTNGPPRESAIVRVETPAGPSTSAATSSALPQPSTEQQPVTPPPPRRPVAKEHSRSVPDTKPQPKPATAANDAARVEPAPTPIHVGGDVVIRGRNANRRVIWRTRDRVIEHSIDGGATWTTEYTADRTIRAGTFVDANVAWLAGDGGLILRRTKNGWFAATSPSDVTVKSVRASSPSKATVTLEDGRVFSTDNGGVSWSAQ